MNMSEDRITLDGTSVRLMNRPLDAYLVEHPSPRRTMTWRDYLTGWNFSSGWGDVRGRIAMENISLGEDYQARWEIINGKLMLTNLFDMALDEDWTGPYNQAPNTALKRIAPALKLPTIATWYSGILVGDWNPINHIESQPHYYMHRPADHYTLIYVERGVIKERREVDRAELDQTRKQYPGDILPW